MIRSCFNTHYLNVEKTLRLASHDLEVSYPVKVAHLKALQKSYDTMHDKAFMVI